RSRMLRGLPAERETGSSDAARRPIPARHMLWLLSARVRPRSPAFFAVATVAIAAAIVPVSDAGARRATAPRPRHHRGVNRHHRVHGRRSTTPASASLLSRAVGVGTTTLPAVNNGTASPAAVRTSAASSPLGGVRWYVDANSNAAIQAAAWRSSRPGDAAQID